MAMCKSIVQHWLQSQCPVQLLCPRLRLFTAQQTASRAMQCTYTYSCRFIGQWRDMDVAIKTVKGPRAAMTPSRDRMLDREISLLQTVRHPNIVLFLGAGVFEDGTAFLVTELMERDTLTSVLHDEDVCLGWRDRSRFALETALGMAHVHSLGRMHRDLKSGNILVSRTMQLKIADFGTASLARITTGGAGAAAGGGGSGATGANGAYGAHGAGRGGHTLGVGTPLWMAPEILAGQAYDGSADVFSFGMVMWEIGAWRLPWGEVAESEGFLDSLLGRLRLGERPEAGAGWPAGYVEVMAACWCTRAAARPSFATLVRELERILY